MNRNWLAQIVAIQHKGYQAFLEGTTIDACPYQTGYRNQNGPGGGLQRQRREAWRQGWRQAQKEINGT